MATLWLVISSSVGTKILLALSGLALAGLELGMSGLSDLNLHGRKVSGNAAKLLRRGVLFHGTILMRADYEAMERFLPIPPDRPGVSHRQFVTSLEQEGISLTAEELMHAVIKGAEKALLAQETT